MNAGKSAEQLEAQPYFARRLIECFGC